MGEQYFNHSLQEDLYYWQYCYLGEAYRKSDLNVQCLPATDKPLYRWGFSTVSTSTVLLLHLIWALSLFIIWIEAEVRGALQQGAFELDQLRGAFILTEAAARTTDRSVDSLISSKPADTSKELSDKTVKFEVLEGDLAFRMLGVRKRQHTGSDEGSS